MPGQSPWQWEQSPTYPCAQCYRTLRNTYSETFWHWDNYHACVGQLSPKAAPRLNDIKCMECWNFEIAQGMRPRGFKGGATGGAKGFKGAPPAGGKAPQSHKGVQRGAAAIEQQE